MCDWKSNTTNVVVALYVKLLLIKHANHAFHCIEDVIRITFSMWRILLLSELTDLFMINRQNVRLEIYYYECGSDFVSKTTSHKSCKPRLSLHRGCN
jgi:hypothetical protein